VQSQRLRNGVDEGKVRHTSRYDIAEVEADEVPILNDGLVAYTAEVDEDEEDERDEEEE
jgi:hypothetical protein